MPPILQRRNRIQMKKWAIIWIFMNVSGPFLGAQELYLEGIARMEEGDYQNAGILFRKALENDSSNPDLCLKLAETCYQSGEFLAAIQWAGTANELSPGTGNYIIARSHAMNGQAAEAVTFLEEHLKSPFKLPRYEILLDPAFGRIEKSESWKNLWKENWYTESEDLEFEVAYLRRSGDYIKALEEIASGLTSRPRWHELYAEKGNTLLLMGNEQDAIRAFARAVEISPGSTEYYLGRARASVQLGKYNDAIRDMEHVLRIKPEMLHLYRELSLTCASAGRYREGTENIRQYILYYPDSAEAHFIDGSIHYQAGQLLQALSSFNRCLDLDDTRAKYFEARGIAYLNTDTWIYALKDFSMALDLDPVNPDTWYHKGLCRQRLNDPEGARSDFETAARYGSTEAIEMLERMNR
jgi:tetratricopeptide (TPR) repeat protein